MLFSGSVSLCHAMRPVINPLFLAGIIELSKFCSIKTFIKTTNCLLQKVFSFGKINVDNNDFVTQMILNPGEKVYFFTFTFCVLRS